MEEANQIIFFYNILYSSSEDSDEEDLEENILYVRNERPKIKNFVEEVVDQYTEQEFRENFRMFRDTFEFILNIVENKIASSIEDVGRHTISAKAQLLLTIWYLATPDCYRSICNRFNVGKATGFRSVRRVVNALFEMAPQFINWPSMEETEDIKNGFSRFGLEGVIGCIDGTYIPIPLPADDGPAYICRKKFPSIILQGICDHNLLFRHCYAGEVGSSHDASVFRNSEVWTYMSIHADEKFPEGTYILGDKAYPCLPNLLTPYKDNGHLTPQNIFYNIQHSATRSAIERCFGLLKKRWRCLKFLDIRNIAFIPKLIITCCILHNICIMQNDLIEINVEELEIIEDNEEMLPNANEERNLKQAGLIRRNIICADLNRRMQ